MTAKVAMSTVQHKPPRVLSGRWVVAGMLALGVVFTAALWFYWYFHMQPFRPLQQALAAEYPESAPRVEGGQRKLHKDTPRILRITMRVDFDPTAETDRAEQFLRQVAAFVQKRDGLAGYERFELHLYHPVPEQEIRQRTYTRPVEELLDAQADSGETKRPAQPASERNNRNAPTSTRNP